MAGRYVLFSALVFAIILSCSSEQPERNKSGPVILFKSKPQPLSDAERARLDFPPELIMQVEEAAGTRAEPFFETVLKPSENLKGKSMIVSKRLAGFSVRTREAQKLVESFSGAIRPQGYLIFRSELNYGTIPDIVTVIRGRSQYDILRVQKTGASNYRLNTKAIITWLKRENRRRPFVITGAGPTWLEARFLRPPKNVRVFAKRISRFAPDVVNQGTKSIKELSREIQATNTFYLWWD